MQIDPLRYEVDQYYYNQVNFSFFSSSNVDVSSHRPTVFTDRRRESSTKSGAKISWSPPCVWLQYRSWMPPSPKIYKQYKKELWQSWLTAAESESLALAETFTNFHLGIWLNFGTMGRSAGMLSRCIYSLCFFWVLPFSMWHCRHFLYPLIVDVHTRRQNIVLWHQKETITGTEWWATRLSGC